MPYAESFKEALTNPLAQLFNLNTGEILKLEQVFKGERYGKLMNYTITDIDCFNFKVSVKYNYYGSDYDDELTLRKISQMTVVKQ